MATTVIYTLSLHDALPISVDVLPKQIFEMMVLPDGQMAAGSRFSSKVPMGDVSVSVDALQGEIANIHYTMNAKVDRKSTRLNSSHMSISYAVFCLKKKI